MEQKITRILGVVAGIAIIATAGIFVWKKGILGNKNTGNQNINVSKNDKWLKTPEETNSENKNRDISTGNATVESEQESAAEGKRSPEKPDENLRQQIISYFNQNLNKILPPPKGDEWDTPIYYFVGNSHLYVELYGAETELTGLWLLYKIEKEGDTLKPTELARYKEGEEDWILASGKNEFAGYIMEEYDLSEDNNKWEKTDEFAENEYISRENDNSDITGEGGRIIR